MTITPDRLYMYTTILIKSAGPINEIVQLISSNLLRKKSALSHHLISSCYFI
jgi:hypothetical protein